VVLEQRKDRGLFTSVGEGDNGLGIVVGRIGQNAVMARGMLTEDDFGAGRGLDAEELRADGHAAIGADFDLGAEAPDLGPLGEFDLAWAS